MTVPTTRVLILATASLAGLAVAPAARAQERPVSVTVRTTIGGPSSGGGMISRRSIERWSRILALTEEQKQALESLHEGYQSSYQEAQKELNTTMQEVSRAFEESQDPGVFGEKIPPARKKFEEKSRAAEQSLMADARALLTAEQEKAWPRIERMRRREQGARLSTITGDAVDLTQIVEDLKITPDATLSQALEEYEIEADRGIAERIRIAKDAPSMEGGAIDPGALQKQMDEQREAGLKLKDVNHRYARKIEPLVPEERQEEFRQAVKRQTFPQVYRPTLTSKWLDATQKLEDLDTEQRQAVSDLKTQYERELASANEAWAAAIERSEAKPESGGALAGGGGMMVMRFGDDDPDLAAARKARRELDSRTQEKLKNLLRAEQREKLPKAQEEGDFTVAPVGGARMIVR
jgi:Spy/CpxP family protein refolding chaperone